MDIEQERIEKKIDELIAKSEADKLWKPVRDGQTDIRAHIESMEAARVRDEVSRIIKDSIKNGEGYFKPGADQL